MTAPEIENPRPDSQHPEQDLMQAANQAGRDEAAPASVRRYRAMMFQGILILAVISFSVLALFASTTAYFPVDLQITLAVQSIRIPAFGSLMEFVSWIGFAPQSVVLTGFLIGMLYSFGFHWEAAMAAIAAVFVETTNALIKVLVHRPRPDDDLVNVVALLNSFSFPSGHVMFYTGFLGFMWFLVYTLLKRSWKRTLLLIFFGGEVALVGISRIFLGQHWFSDVVGAYLLGFITLVVIIFVYRWGKPRFFVRQPAAREPKNLIKTE